MHAVVIKNVVNMLLNSLYLVITSDKLIICIISDQYRLG